MGAMSEDRHDWWSRFRFKFRTHAVPQIGADYSNEDRYETTNLELANVYSSIQPGNADVHRPVLDLDLPAWLTPSSTPGHYHLAIDKPMTWDQYRRLLRVMAEVGILEPGYVSASEQRGYTSARLPWVRKQTEQGR